MPSTGRLDDWTTGHSIKARTHGREGEQGPWSWRSVSPPFEAYMARGESHLHIYALRSSQRPVRRAWAGAAAGYYVG
jgi:hypothetical protein